MCYGSCSTLQTSSTRAAAAATPRYEPCGRDGRLLHVGRGTGRRRKHTYSTRRVARASAQRCVRCVPTLAPVHARTMTPSARVAVPSLCPRAQGVKLEALLKLKDTRSTQAGRAQFTLLHFLLEHCQQHKPAALRGVVSDLEPCGEASLFPYDYLLTDVKRIEADLTRLRQVSTRAGTGGLCVGGGPVVPQENACVWNACILRLFKSMGAKPQCAVF